MVTLVDPLAEQEFLRLHGDMMALPDTAPLEVISEIGSQYAAAFETFYQRYEVSVYYNSGAREFNKAVAQIRKRHRQVAEFLANSRTLRRDRLAEMRTFNTAAGDAIESLLAMGALSQLHGERVQAINNDTTVADLHPDISMLIDFHSKTKARIAALSDALFALFEPQDDI